MNQVTAGQIIKALDFGHIMDSYITAEVTSTNSLGEVEGTIISRFEDGKDVTAFYSDPTTPYYDGGVLYTLQNGTSMSDNIFGDRLSVIGVAMEEV